MWLFTSSFFAMLHAKNIKIGQCFTKLFKENKSGFVFWDSAYEDEQTVCVYVCCHPQKYMHVWCGWCHIFVTVFEWMFAWTSCRRHVCLVFKIWGRWNRLVLVVSCFSTLRGWRFLPFNERWLSLIFYRCISHLVSYFLLSTPENVPSVLVLNISV